MSANHAQPAVHKTIWAGYLFILLMLIGLAVLAYGSLSRSRASSSRLAEESVVRTELATKLERSLSGLQYNLTVFGLGNKTEQFAEALLQLDHLQLQLAQARALITPHADLSGFGAAVQELGTLLPTYKAKALELKSQRERIASSRDKANGSFDRLNEMLAKYAAGSDSDALLDLVLLQQVSAVRINTLEAFVDRNTDQAQKTLERLRGFKRQVAENAEISAALSVLVADLDSAVSLFGAYEATYASMAATGTQMTRKAMAIGETETSAMREVSLRTAEQLAGTTTAVMGGMIAALILGVGIAMFVSRRVRAALSEIARQMAETAQKLVGDADHLAANSQLLSDEASAQAATLEETRAALTEVNEMTSRNEALARKVAAATQRAASSAQGGTAEMHAMKASVEEIDQSANEIAGIVKTIDEIAFKTNLLALNAAIEAARAGSVGAGFAVVADEVRQLALKSAEAARMTAVKVEQSLAKTQRGVRHATQASSAFDSVVAQTRELADHANQIATLSQQQRTSLGQVVGATEKLDQVAQSTAARAQDTSSAATNMHDHVQSVLAAMRGLQSGNPIREEASAAQSRMPSPVPVPAA
ncbi:MAG: methyl-accepting chemotaxis protein [Opitutales bacterium]